MSNQRKIFYVVATGGHDTDRHYSDTIKKKRTIEEAARFISPSEVEILKRYLRGRPYAVWGSKPGPGNKRTWNSMEQGDYVMIYRNGRVVLAAEVALKVHNPDLARYFWTEEKGETWEYMYFLVNDVEVNVKQTELNKYLEWGESAFPHGFTPITQKKVNKLLSTYGDLLSLLQKLQSGEKIEEVDVEKKKVFQEVVEERIEKAPSEHDEMQWRLIRIGNSAHFDVWIPPADQNKQYQNNIFRNYVISEFHEALDIPSYIKNIDTVWKLGLSIKAAFEIEHSTAIYSGILRLSDLRALAPNSNYPLFIVADKRKKDKVLSQLQRPTFCNDYLHLDKVVHFLSYDRVRQLDEQQEEDDWGFDVGQIYE